MGKFVHQAVIAGLAAGAMVSAACTSVYHTETEGGFSSGPLSSAGGVPLQVDGAVGDQKGEPLAQSVAAAMPSSVRGADIHYAPCAASTECAGDHLVWTFGPPTVRPASAYPPAISRNVDWIGSYRPSPNNVTAKLALFENGTVVASAAGQVDASSPNDPAFQALVGEMTRSVLSGPGWFDWID